MHISDISNSSAFQVLKQGVTPLKMHFPALFLSLHGLCVCVCACVCVYVCVSGERGGGGGGWGRGRLQGPISD